MAVIATVLGFDETRVTQFHPDYGNGGRPVTSKQTATLFAIFAAALYALSAPVSKLLLQQVAPTMMAGFLYLGAGLGMGALLAFKILTHRSANEQWLVRRDFPYTVAMVLLDIAAPIFLMFGILKTTSANVSLLNNFEIVATAVIALVVFKEAVSRRLWFAILLVTIASIILGFEGASTFAFNQGSLWVLCACICWGVENNCTRSISDKSAAEIVLIKGVFSGLGSLIIAVVIGAEFPAPGLILAVMALGFVAYGLSINFYIKAQSGLGAAKTSAFYSIAPFLGVIFSFIFLGERPNLQFFIALAVMLVATVIMVKDTLGGQKLYPGFVHTHEHRHGDLVHTHEHRHLIFSPLHAHSHAPAEDAA